MVECPVCGSVHGGHLELLRHVVSKRDQEHVAFLRDFREFARRKRAGVHVEEGRVSDSELLREYLRKRGFVRGGDLTQYL